MDEKLILNEILNIRKKMGLPLDREYKNFLIETLNPGLIMEQKEANLAMKALRKIFPTLTVDVTDDFIKGALLRKPIDIEVGGVKYSINMLSAGVSNYNIKKKSAIFILSDSEKLKNNYGFARLLKFSPLYPEYWGLHGQKF